MGVEPDAADEVAADVEMARVAHRALRVALESPIDVTEPSRLPEWTRGHVLAHITNSGNGHLNMFDGAATGEVRAQYPHGVDGRAADIEAGSTRSLDEHRTLLAASIDRLDATWETTDWQGTGITPRGGTVSLTDLPFLRTREVAIHHIDLGIGFEFADLSSRYVRLELRRMEMLWRAKQAMGMGSLPTPILALDPSIRLAWFMGRAVIDDVPPADVF